MRIRGIALALEKENICAASSFTHCGRIYDTCLESTHWRAQSCDAAAPTTSKSEWQQHILDCEVFQQRTDKHCITDSLAAMSRMGEVVLY